MEEKEKELNGALESILSAYKEAFSQKVYSEENDDHDPLMDVYGITPELKRENRQYWGRELGMCWQRLVVEVCRRKKKGFGPALLQASKDLSECMRLSGWSTSAPFDKVSLIVKYGADTSQKVEIGRINKHKELEASIQIPLQQLQNW